MKGEGESETKMINNVNTANERCVTGGRTRAVAKKTQSKLTDGKKTALKEGKKINMVVSEASCVAVEEKGRRDGGKEG